MAELKIYRCTHCGNIVEKIIDGGVTPVCCGEDMQLLKANTTDAAGEKHVPVITVDGNKVHAVVGEVLHPMTEEHLIQFIILQTEKGVQRVDLKPNQEPSADFVLADGDKAVTVYEWCNLHGLWKADA